jgi:hypothetical protein
MKELKIVTGFKKLQSDLSGMTYKQKLEHIWTYYRWKFILVILSVILSTSLIVSIVQNKGVNIIIGGVSVNTSISQEGEAYLTEGYKAHVGSTSDKERFSFAEHDVQNPLTNPNANASENYQKLEILLTLCANKQIDYLITDREAFEILVKQNACADLNRIFSAEEIAKLGDQIIYYQPDGSTQKIPVAINIQNTAFIQDNTDATGMVYFIFVSNSERLEQARNLYDYLLAWPAKK